MLSALTFNQLSVPAVPILSIYLSERNIPLLILILGTYKQQVNQRLVTIILSNFEINQN